MMRRFEVTVDYKEAPMHRKPFSSILFGVWLALATAAALADRPPPNGKALSALLEDVERSHPGVIMSAEFDDRRWELVTCASEGRSCRELSIDAISGKELRSSSESDWGRRPPAGGKTASQVARAVEERKLGVITEMEFEQPAWEVSVRGESTRAKLYLDPMSGEVQRCRGRGCPTN